MHLRPATAPCLPGGQSEQRPSAPDATGPATSANPVPRPDSMIAACLGNHERQRCSAEPERSSLASRLSPCPTRPRVGSPRGCITKIGLKHLLLDLEVVQLPRNFEPEASPS